MAKVNLMKVRSRVSSGKFAGLVTVDAVRTALERYGFRAAAESEAGANFECYCHKVLVGDCLVLNKERHLDWNLRLDDIIEVVAATTRNARYDGEESTELEVLGNMLTASGHEW